MSINAVKSNNYNINNNLQAKEDKKNKKAAGREKIKTSYDLYREKKKGMTRDQKTLIKAGVLGVAAAIYLWLSGNGVKLFNKIKKAFQ